jgi:trans-aconitate methyltransferase
MDGVLKLYEDAFRQHGDSPQAVLWPKGRQEERFQALTRHIPASGHFSVLDYGCGLAHLKAFLDERYPSFSYAGADAVAVFVDACRTKYPDASFFHAQSPVDVPGVYDHVVSSGAFNILYTPDATAHRDIVFRFLGLLFEKTRVSLSVNFMTDAVDYRQTDAYHQSVAELYAFAVAKLSRRLSIDQSYIPYEYTLTVWKSPQIAVEREHAHGPSAG